MILSPLVFPGCCVGEDVLKEGRDSCEGSVDIICQSEHSYFVLRVKSQPKVQCYKTICRVALHFVMLEIQD